MKNKEIFTFLSQFTIFKDLHPSEMEPIVDIATLKLYDAETIVFLQDEPITNVYFIHAGKVKIYKTDYDGKEQIVNVLQKDDMFPHQGFFRKGNYPAHAEIIEKARLVNIPILSFEHFLLTHPEICMKMFRVLGGIIVDLQQRLEEKMLYNTYDQIMLLLMRLATKNGLKMDDNKYKLSVHLTNSELANMIGSSRETINRTINQLKKEKLIETDDKGYLIIHHDDLKKAIFPH